MQFLKNRDTPSYFPGLSFFRVSKRSLLNNFLGFHNRPTRLTTAVIPMPLFHSMVHATIGPSVFIARCVSRRGGAIDSVSSTSYVDIAQPTLIEYEIRVSTSLGALLRLNILVRVRQITNICRELISLLASQTSSPYTIRVRCPLIETPSNRDLSKCGRFLSPMSFRKVWFVFYKRNRASTNP